MWSSKWQATIALSTIEAEYVTMLQGAQQMSWMHSWLDEVKIKYSLPGFIKGDNCEVIALMKNTKDHGKIKYIDICHHYIWELRHSGAIILEQVPSADNLADLFTKSLPWDHHQHFLTTLNIDWIDSPCMGECWNIPRATSEIVHYWYPSYFFIFSYLPLFHPYSLPVSIYSSLYIQATLSHYCHTWLRVSSANTFSFYSCYLLPITLVDLFTIGLCCYISIRVVTTYCHTQLRLIYLQYMICPKSMISMKCYSSYSVYQDFQSLLTNPW